MAAVTVVEVANRFALEPAPAQQAEQLKRALLEAAGESSCLIMDAAQMAHIFSFEVAVLVHVSEALRQQGGKLAVCTADEKLLLVIEMLGLTELLDIYDDVPTSLEANDWTRGDTVPFSTVAPS